MQNFKLISSYDDKLVIEYRLPNQATISIPTENGVSLSGNKLVEYLNDFVAKKENEDFSKKNLISAVDSSLYEKFGISIE